MMSQITLSPIRPLILPFQQKEVNPCLRRPSRAVDLGEGGRSVLCSLSSSRVVPRIRLFSLLFLFTSTVLAENGSRIKCNNMDPDINDLTACKDVILE